MKVSDDLYNPGPLLTFEGAAIAVLTASGAIGHALEFNPKWLGLVIALVIPLGGLLLLPDDSEVFRNKRSAVVLVALFHGLVIYNLSVGLNAIHQAIPVASASKASVVPMIDPLPWWTSAEQERAARNLIAEVRNLQRSEDWVGWALSPEGHTSVTNVAALVNAAAAEKARLAEAKTRLAEVRARLAEVKASAAEERVLSAEVTASAAEANALAAKAQFALRLGSLASRADELERTYSGSEGGRRRHWTPKTAPTPEK